MIHSSGRQIKYLPLCLAMGICPDEPRSFFLQQYRWCMGTCTLVLDWEFWRSSISKMHKMCFINGLFYYTQTALVGGCWCCFVLYMYLLCRPRAP